VRFPLNIHKYIGEESILQWYATRRSWTHITTNATESWDGVFIRLVLSYDSQIFLKKTSISNKYHSLPTHNILVSSTVYGTVLHQFTKLPCSLCNFMLYPRHMYIRHKACFRYGRLRAYRGTFFALFFIHF